MTTETRRLILWLAGLFSVLLVFGFITSDQWLSALLATIGLS